MNIKKNHNNSFFSILSKSWQLTSIAFANSSNSYIKKQQLKVLFCNLRDPHFALKWYNIFNSSELVWFTQERPQIYLKAFRAYMSIRWSSSKRIKVILDTYQFINNKGIRFMSIVKNNNKVKLINFNISNGAEVVLNLEYDYRFRKEGELVFSIECNDLGGRIVAAAFSFEEEGERNWVCRIGCIQGHPVSEIYYSKIFQKHMFGLRPKSLVFFFVQEFSRQLGVGGLYGAGDAIQTYRGKHLIHISDRHTIKFDYDALWNESGGKLNKDGWYILPLLMTKKKHDQIKINKRALYQKRYKLLDELSLKIKESVNQLM